MAVKLKKHQVSPKLFVLFLTILVFWGCHSVYHPTLIEGKRLPVTETAGAPASLEATIQPYRASMEKDLATILAIAPEPLEKTTGEWQTNIGCLMADASMVQGDSVFVKRTGNHLDFCLLNHGGIRASIGKGNVTVGSVFEVMPFENSMVVVTLRTEAVQELVNYVIREKKPHPLSGLTFTIDSSGKAQNIAIQGVPLRENASYQVLTSDYLSNGGDNMVFFQGQPTVTLDYKLRNVLMDYFRKSRTLKTRYEPRITVEK